MKNRFTLPETSVSVVEECLIVSLSCGMNSQTMESLGRKILDGLRRTNTRKVILNVSTVNMMDSHDFRVLRGIAAAVSMMGGKAVFVGFQPGVASFLVDMDMDFSGMLTAVSTEDALEILRGSEFVEVEEAEEELDEDKELSEKEEGLEIQEIEARNNGAQ